MLGYAAESTTLHIYGETRLCSTVPRNRHHDSSICSNSTRHQVQGSKQSTLLPLYLSLLPPLPPLPLPPPLPSLRCVYGVWCVSCLPIDTGNQARRRGPISTWQICCRLTTWHNCNPPKPSTTKVGFVACRHSKPTEGWCLCSRCSREGRRSKRAVFNLPLAQHSRE
jgi:hypothetical protein